jgi:hypothetical protein
MSGRNENVPTSVLLLTALHRTRVHDAPFRSRSSVYFKKFLNLKKNFFCKQWDTFGHLCEDHSSDA